MKRCPRCGYENSDSATICERCRYPLTLSSESFSSKCPRCGYENPPGASICERCRYPLKIVPFQVEETRREDRPREESMTRLRDGALYLTIGVLFLLISLTPINTLVQSIFGLVSVVFLGMGTGSYSVAFRLFDEKLRNSSLLSFLLLPGFLLLVSGIGVVELNVAKLNLTDLSKNPLAVILIDLGFILFVIGGLGITIGVYKIANAITSSRLKVGALLSLIGLISFLLLPELGFLFMGGQFLIYLESRTLIHGNRRRST
ncbi:MAG: zinc ribbon domain-containing protein [Metallosphaera prunae]|uniref:double zinc ribbon domain-containing protein n=1 Tax=Metallosphaera prunae TaxID=47304 RepID=UPI00227379B8|nr:zinc ribbon domain-containing protein [Metallosphaera prunae]MCY0861216.1 zinc ribbon domain-containing protein [Metallosphaera prunae]